MKKIIIRLTCLMLFFTLVSCEKWLTIQPEDEIEKTKLYETEEGFWQALTGIYSLVLQEREPMGAFQTQEIEYLAGIWEAGSETKNGKLSQHEYKDKDVDQALADMFLYQYNLIAHANTILEYVNQVKFLPEKSYNLIKGEALAIRAWAHFDLIRLWGPMPENIDQNLRYLPYVRLASKKVNVYDSYNDFMNYLVSDLDSARILLSKSEPLLKASCITLNSDNNYLPNERLEFRWRQNRFNYYAVLGLKARVALWMKDYPTALQCASEVKESKNPDGTLKFTLGTEADINLTLSFSVPADNTFKKEHLYSHPMVTYNVDQDYAAGEVKTAISNVNSLFTDVNDVRYKLCWKLANSKATTYKYASRFDLWIPLIRLSEMYLIIMETAPLNLANQIYEEYCKSRGCEFISMNENVRKSVILKEYCKEFFAEGQIFYVHKRMGIRNMLWTTKPMTEAHYVLPIPEREIDIY